MGSKKRDEPSKRKSPRTNEGRLRSVMRALSHHGPPSSTVALSVGHVDLGVARPSTADPQGSPPVELTADILIENVGSSPARVDSGGVNGIHQGAFSFRFGAPARPFTIPAGSSIPIRITFSSATTGTKTATLAISGDFGEVRAPLIASVIDGQLIVSPQGLVFDADDFPNYPVKRFLLENAGLGPLSVEIRPPNTPFFSLEPEDPAYGDVTQPHGIDTGQSVVFAVRFSPGPPFSFDATGLALYHGSVQPSGNGNLGPPVSLVGGFRRPVAGNCELNTPAGVGILTVLGEFSERRAPIANDGLAPIVLRRWELVDAAGRRGLTLGGLHIPRIDGGGIALAHNSTTRVRVTNGPSYPGSSVPQTITQTDAGGFVDLLIGFRPTTTQQRNLEVELTYECAGAGAGGSDRVRFPLTGFVAAPKAALIGRTANAGPYTIGFGTRSPSAPDAIRVATVLNVGTAPLTVTAILEDDSRFSSSAGDLDDEFFTIEQGRIDGATNVSPTTNRTIAAPGPGIPPGSSFEIEIRFAESIDGLYVGILRVQTNDPELPFQNWTALRPALGAGEAAFAFVARVE